jgi:transaldolase|tara:strand:+ start:365 stop:1039 length:675 start_codon:yes stop_codon:yes gene_type:complete
MKIFLDTADTDTIRRCYNTGMIDGVTTNPTLIMKSGKSPTDVYQAIKDIGIKDISMEVVGDYNEMVQEGQRLYNRFGSVATIKVPCTEDGLMACSYLAKEGIKVNVTLIFSAAQAILAAKSGATYVSPFVGRLDDQSVAGLEVVRSISELYRIHGIKTQVLSASIRSVQRVVRSYYNGAQVVTMPPDIFQKMYSHVLTDKGLEIFDKDWAEVTHKVVSPHPDEE